MCLFVFSFAIEHDKFLSYGFGHYDASLFEALLPRQQVGGLKRVEYVAELFFLFAGVGFGWAAAESVEFLVLEIHDAAACARKQHLAGANLVGGAAVVGANVGFGLHHRLRLLTGLTAAQIENLEHHAHHYHQCEYI